MLYDLGYSVFSIDMYGKGIRPQETKEKKTMTRSLYADEISWARFTDFLKEQF